MVDSPISGFVKRSEASKKFSISFRNFGKDLSKALALRDDEFLKHLKLRTKDGKVREGTTITPTLVIDLKNKGMVPTWFVETEWLKERYRKRSRGKPDEPVESITEAKIIDAEVIEDYDTAEKPPEDDDESEVLALLQNPIILLQSDKLAMKDNRIAELEADRKLLKDTIAALTEAVKQQPRQKSDEPTVKEKEPKYLPTVRRLGKAALSLASKRVW